MKRATARQAVPPSRQLLLIECLAQPCPVARPHRDAMRFANPATRTTLLFSGRDSRDGWDTLNPKGFFVPTCPDLGAQVGTGFVRWHASRSKLPAPRLPHRRRNDAPCVARMASACRARRAREAGHTRNLPHQSRGTQRKK